jgi:hypothetical protein
MDIDIPPNPEREKIKSKRRRRYFFRQIPFYSSSPSVYLSNNMSGLKNANFVDIVLQDLLHKY